MPRPRTGARIAGAALVAALLGVAAVGGPERGAPGPRVGVLHDGAPPAALSRTFAEAVQAHLPQAELLTRGAADDTAAHAALAEFKIEDVRLVVAFGDAAAARAVQTVRGLPVVVAGLRFPTVIDAGSHGHVCGTEAALPTDELWTELRRAVPGLGTLAVLVQDGHSGAAARLEALAAARSAPGSAAGARVHRLAYAEAPVPDGVAAVYLPADVPAAEAEALADELAGRGIALIGSTSAHLDAGCAVVLRPSLRNAGLLTVVQMRRVLAGEDPRDVGMRRVRRVHRDVNLPAARRLRYDVPLTVLAAADHVVPALAERR